MVEYLINIGCDVNIKNVFKETPLSISVSNENDMLTELLILNKSKPNIISSVYLYRENEQKFDQILKKTKNINVRDSYGNTSLHYAVKYNLYNIVVKLINNKAIINMMNYRGKTPLDLIDAKAKGHKIIYNILKKKGAKTSKEMKNITDLIPDGINGMWHPNIRGFNIIKYVFDDFLIF